jgi:hypothetical protein
MILSNVKLSSLKHAVLNLKGQDGVEQECIVIPIAKNNLTKNEYGIELGLVHFDIKKEGSKSTHIIKQSLPKDIRESMTKEEQEAMPILGNSIVSSYSQKVDEPTEDYAEVDYNEALPF